MRTYLEKNLWQNLQALYGYTDLEIRRIKYSLEVIFSEISKMIIMFFIFCYLGSPREYVLSLFVLLTTRQFAGGLHMKNYISCFLFSLFTMLLSVELIPRVSIPYAVQSICIFICIWVTYIIGPLTSSRRPVLFKASWQRFRLRATLIMGGYFVLSLCYHRMPFSLVIFGTIVTQTLQLIVARLLRKGVLYHDNISGT